MIGAERGRAAGRQRGFAQTVPDSEVALSALVATCKMHDVEAAPLADATTPAHIAAGKGLPTELLHKAQLPLGERAGRVDALAAQEL